MDYNKIYEKNKRSWGKKSNELLASVLADLKPGLNFLDLGCGQGRDSFFMARNNFKVTAVDKSDVGIGDINKEVKKANLKNKIKAVCVDIKDFKIEKSGYGIINSIDTFHFLKKIVGLKILNKVKQGLKKNGLFIFMDFTPKDPSFKKKGRAENGYFTLKELLTSFSDFKIILCQDEWVKDPGHPGHDKPHRHHIVKLIAQKV